jgi:UbiD family decarboxylase
VGGLALLFENVQGAEFPVAINLMGTVERIYWAMNLEQKTRPLATTETAEKTLPSDRFW